MEIFIRKSRTGATQKNWNWAKSRTGQNQELDKNAIIFILIGCENISNPTRFAW
jgi:hypothetical protein